jgi:valyl-tRNA synthetase
MRLLVPMAGLIDKQAERERLTKQREKVSGDLGKSRSKLDNKKFVNNAPATVVTQEKQRVVDFEQQIAQLDEQLARLETLN